MINWWLFGCYTHLETTSVFGVINCWYKEGLAAGDSKTTYKKYIWPDDCKSHTIKVVVDAKGNISESNEDNNERLKIYTKLPRPFNIRTASLTRTNVVYGDHIPFQPPAFTVYEV